MSLTKAEDQPIQLTVAVMARGPQVEALETLRCVSEIADELLFVCAEPSGNIVGEAAKMSARIIEMPWTDDYSALRNEAISQARGKWLLWLEPGELIAAENLEALSQFVDTLADSASAYQLFVQAPWTMNSPVREQIGQVRLLPKRSGIKYEGRVNETAAESLKRLGMTIEPLDCVVHHAEACAIETSIRAQWEDRLRLANMEMAASGNEPRVLLSAGMACSLLHRLEEADQYFRESLDSPNPRSSEVLDAYYGILTLQDQKSGNASQQIETCLKALELYPLDAQLLCGLGTYMLRQGRMDLAARSFRVALEHGRVDPATWHVADINQVAACCLSLTLQHQGNLREAQKVLEKVLGSYPESHRVRRQLLDLHVRRNDQGAALATFDLLPADMPHREALRTAVRGGVFAAQQDWASAEPYLSSAYNAGCRDPLCLRWLAITYLAIDRKADAMPLLEAWQEAEPHSVEPKAILDSLQAGPQEIPMGMDQGHDVPAPLGSQKTPVDERQIRFDSNSKPEPPDMRPASPVQPLRSPLDPPPSAPV